MTAKTNYNLSMTTDSYKDLQKIAEQDGTTVAELMRKAIKWLMFIRKLKSDDPNARLFVEQGGETREIITDLV